MTQTFTDREILRFVKYAGRAGCDTIHITGGEPMLRPGIIPLLENIWDHPRVERLILSTNGSLPTQQELDEILTYVDEIHVSLDAMQAFDLAEICGTGQVMKNIIHTAWTACTRGIKTRLTTVLIDQIRPHLALLTDNAKQMDFDICFKELQNGDYPKNVVPLPMAEALAVIQKRYPDLVLAQPCAADASNKEGDPVTDFYSTSALKGRIGFVHTNCEREDMIYLDSAGVLHCGKQMRKMINLRAKLNQGLSLEALQQYFEE